MGKLVIHEVRQTNHLMKKSLPDDFSNMISSGYGERGGYHMKVIFRDTAVEELWEEIFWRQSTRKNRVEQGGLLVGIFCDAAFGVDEILPWVEVWHVIPCRNPSESRRDFIRMSAENWGEMYAELDQLNEETNLHLVPVGWYHTHPQNIPAVFSNIDMATHSQQFTYDYNVGVVFNPQQGTWMAYYGPQCRKCESYLTMNDHLSASYGIIRSIYKKASKSRDNERRYDEGQTDVRRNEGYEVFRYHWYLLRQVSWFGSRKFERERVNPPQNDAIKNTLCAIAEMLEHNVRAMKTLNENLKGILTTAVIEEDKGEYCEANIKKCYFYNEIGELMDIREASKHGKIAMLYSETYFDFFQYNDFMMGLMADLGVTYFIVCTVEKVFNVNCYGFEVLVKDEK